MAEKDYDVIVVGAGVAGICCTGELVLQGMRPLLICETKEVAYNLRSVFVQGNRAVVQSGCVQLTGAWWLPLARALNAKLGPLLPSSAARFALAGDKTVHEVRGCYPTAASVTDMLVQLSPIPLGDSRDEIERLMVIASNIPFEELMEMDRVLLADWLAKETTDQLATMFFLMLGGLINVAPLPAVHDNVSVFGLFAYLRGWLMGEALLPECFPDYREGVWIPMAKAIEERGGTVWRGRKVARVLTEAGRVTGVLMEDGAEVHASTVAIGTGNARIPKLFDPMPPEVDRLASFEFNEDKMVGYYVFALLEGEVLPPDFRHWMGVLSAGADWGQLQYLWPSHERAPGSVEPGKQMLVGALIVPSNKVEELGGAEALYAQIHDTHEFYFPGYKDAIIEVKTEERVGGMWFGQGMVATKLDRRSESIKGLWYVGDGSRPIAGIWTEAAASAGILGARAIAAAGT